MNKDILIFGKGYIGQKLQEAFSCNITSKRIKDFSDAKTEVEKNNPKIIINCIGYTGERSIDDCELDKDKTLFANTFIPAILGDLAFRRKIKLVHISSGCIYNFNYQKSKPITEEDEPDFLNLFYSRSKIYAENILKSLFNCANVLIVRIRVPLDNSPHPKNILTKLLSFKKVINAPNSITYIPDFAKMLKFLIEIDAKGIYNAVNKGELKYSELLEAYGKQASTNSYDIIDGKDLNLVRTNLIMSVEKLEKKGFKVRDIHEVIEECVSQYLKS